MPERIRSLTGTVSDSRWWGEITLDTMSSALGPDPKADVTLIIHSPGGDASAGLAIAGMVRRHQGRVRVEIDGYAASAASAIVVAADEIVMAPGAMIMLHEPQSIVIARVQKSDAIKIYRRLRSYIAAYAAHYAAETPISDQQARRMMADETWLTAQQAADLGLATVAETGRPAPAPEEPPAMVDAEVWTQVAALSIGGPMAKQQDDPKDPSQDQGTGTGDPPEDDGVSPPVPAFEAVVLDDGTQALAVPVAEWEDLKAKVEDLEQMIADRTEELDERNASDLQRRIDDAIQVALTEGQITPAEEATWRQRLSDNFELMAPVLADLKANKKYRRLSDPLNPAANGTGETLSHARREAMRAAGWSQERIDSYAKSLLRGGAAEVV